MKADATAMAIVTDDASVRIWLPRPAGSFGFKKPIV
jgi:hypothetical protein